MTAKVFIDGEAGTTGLQIRARLESRSDIELLHLSDAERKDAARRREMLNEADLAILCLPDEAAREAVALVENNETKIIDASTAHRTADGWVYGFPEYEPGQHDAIAKAGRVANPGCYALTSVAILHPLVGAGIINAETPVTINAVSGYTGGGKGLIAEFENPQGQNGKTAPGAFFTYAHTLAHKHVPEITKWSGLAHPPLFVPSVGRYAQGMIVQVPLQLWSLPGKPAPEAVHKALADHYGGARFVSVMDLEDSAQIARLDPEALNGTNELRLHVFADAGQAVVMGLLDNLGKGASGQAVQNLNIMLGLPEDAGL